MKRVIPYFTILIALLLKTSGAGTQLPQLPGKPNQKDESLKGAQIILGKPSVAGDGKTAGFVQLAAPATAGLTLNLTSSNPQVAKIDQSAVTIGAGKTKSDRFSIITKRVTQNTLVTLTASVGNAKITQVLTVTVRIDSITIVPTAIIGGMGAVGTLVLSGAAPAGAQAFLTSSNTQVVRFGVTPISSAQETATINLAGGATAGYSLATGVVQQNTLVTINASYNGVTVTKTIGVTKQPGT